jgi:predicted amidohydrolase
MKIALVSLNQIWEDKNLNLVECEKYIKDASLNDVKLIIFPEMTLTAFSINTDLISEKENNSFTISSFKELSIKYNIAIVFGVVIKEKIKSSNRMYFLDNNGNTLEYYKKIHPFSFANEDDYYVSGEDIKVIEFNNVKFGLTICYDLRFSNLYHEISKQNTDCIINIANWPSKRIDHWNTLLKARAIENQQFIIGVNRIGIDGNNLEYEKSSNIFNANGEKLNIIKNIDEMKILNINIQEKEIYKNKFNSVQDTKTLNKIENVKYLGYEVIVNYEDYNVYEIIVKNIDQLESICKNIETDGEYFNVEYKEKYQYKNKILYTKTKHIQIENKSIPKK